MDFKESILTVLKDKYATFKGRACRSEFWWFYLLTLVVALVFGLFGKVGRIIDIVWSIAIIVPSLAVGARRLHDIGKSGWYQLLALIPIVGIIILIVWWARPGTNTANEYGEPIVFGKKPEV